jgi:hypothetical protein
MTARLLPLLFGIATRRALADYLRAVAAVLFILLAVAWTIDLAGTFPQLRDAAAERGEPLPFLMGPYLLQRGVDIVTRMLPVAVFFGVFLAEIARRTRLESIVLATAGASPLRAFAALLWLGLLLGALNAGLESRWRPAAVFAQVETGFGSYARRFWRGWLEGVWFVEGDTALRADVLRDDPPRLRDALVFTGIRSDRLETIIGAEEVLPTEIPYLWQLRGVTRWDSIFGEASVRPGGDTRLELELIPEQLQYAHIPAFYLPSPALKAMAAMRSPPPGIAGIRTALWRRWSAPLLPFALAMLAVGLAGAGFEGRRILVPRLVALAAGGYVFTVAIKTFWALGELGSLPPQLAVLAPPAIGVAVAALFIRRMA